MTNSILDSPLLRHSKPWWFPFISLSLTLYGILVLNWNLQPVVILFWLEIILIAAAALIRALFALNGKAFFDQFFQKIFFLAGGAILFGAMIMLAVTFSFKVFDGGMDTRGFETIPTQFKILVTGYIIGLVFHYFVNGRYKTATYTDEMMQAMVHLLVLLVILMVLTMHLIPSYPELNQAKWVGLSVIVVKFLVDLAFTRIRTPFREAFAQNPVSEI